MEWFKRTIDDQAPSIALQKTETFNWNSTLSHSVITVHI